MKYALTANTQIPEKAARKLLEITNATEAVQDGRIHIEKIDTPFLKAGRPRLAEKPPPRF